MTHIIPRIPTIGVVAFGERLDAAAIVGMALILGGVYCLNIVSDVAAH